MNILNDFHLSILISIHFVMCLNLVQFDVTSSCLSIAFPLYKYPSTVTNIFGSIC